MVWLIFLLAGLAVLFIIARLEQSIAGAFGYGTVLLFVAAVSGLLLLRQHREIVADVVAPTVEGAERLPSLARALLVFASAAGIVLVAATSSAAVRMGAFDLAVANLYGSNVMNMSILIWLDALYTKAPLLETINVSNAVAGLVAVLLMMVGLTDIVMRAGRRPFRVDPAAALILVAYLFGVLLVWSVSAR